MNNSHSQHNQTGDDDAAGDDVIDLRGNTTGSGTGAAHSGAASAGKQGSGFVGKKNSDALNLNVDPAKIKAVEQKYPTPELVQQKFPDLIPLIIQTESMNESERDYWYQILPIMTEEQIRKFRGILVNERNQLQKLDQEYDNKMKQLNEKHIQEWDSFAAKKKRDALHQQERAQEEEEKAKEAELLKELEELE